MLVAPALAQGVFYLDGTSSGVFEDLLAETGQKCTSLSSRITLDEDQPSAFHRKWTSAETTHAPPEEPLEPPLHPPAGQRILDALGHNPGPLARTVHRSQQPSGTVEDLVAVRSPDDQAEEIHDLRVREADPLLHVFLIRADLTVDHVAQAQPTRHGLRRILSIQDLGGKILISDHLEQTQADNGLDASGRDGVGQLANDLMGGDSQPILQRSRFAATHNFL